MNKERDEFLTEAMGLLCRCGESGCDKNIQKFSTWTGFGLLWEWSNKQKWFSKLIRQTCYYEMCRNEFSKGNKSIINPNSFANAVYNFLKENKYEYFSRTNI